jgi:hypothetical protein
MDSAKQSFLPTQAKADQRHKLGELLESTITIPKQELMIVPESEPEFLYGTKIMGVDGVHIAHHSWAFLRKSRYGNLPRVRIFFISC